MYLRYLIEEVFQAIRGRLASSPRSRACGVAVLAVVVAFGIRLLLSDGGRERPVAVTGKVLYRGDPVEGARVMFIPTNKRPSSATTDAAGRFVLGTFATNDGAMIGDHSVCIAKAVVEADGTIDSPYMKPKSLLPATYGTPVTSPLKAHVKAGGPNDFTFELKD